MIYENHENIQTMHSAKAMNKYKKKFYKKTANLLTGKSEQSEEDLAKVGKSTKYIHKSYLSNFLLKIVERQSIDLLITMDFRIRNEVKI